jgi:hypothetical protein
MKAPGGMFSTGGGTIEADATYVGGKERNKHASKRTKGNIGGVGKQCVFSLVERGGGVRSFHIPNVNSKNLKPILTAQLDTANTHLMTDGERPLRGLKSMFASHRTVNHDMGEYVRGNVHTNTVEGYFSILKRGIIGTFHSVSEQHLQRYMHRIRLPLHASSGQSPRRRRPLAVRVGHSDQERAVELAKRIGGKRLTYRRTDEAQATASIKTD